MGGATGGTFGSEAKAPNNTVHQGDKDIFITNFEADSGNIVWTRQFGTTGFDSVQCIATDKQVVSPFTTILLFYTVRELFSF